MRRVRIAFIALLLGGIVAGCTAGNRPKPATTGGGPSATTAPTTVQDRGVGEVTDTTPNTTPTAGQGRPSTTEAVATAVAYMRREVGMRDPVAGPFRWTGPSTGRVEIHPRDSEGGQPVTGPITVVSLQRLTSVWYVLGTHTSNIGVTQPGPLAKIASPVRVAGRARAFEGTVQVRVTEDRYGKDTQLGSGVVTGGGDVLRPFAGRIAFRYPVGSTGSILFAERSAANGDVLGATVIRVRFAPAPPFPGIWETTTWKAAYELQDAVDNGHQPWRLGAINVVTLYAEMVLLPGPEHPIVRQTGPNTFTVSRPSGKFIATVQVAQPIKQSGGIWVIIGVDRTP
jgi:Immunoglobulin-like domain of bacterial spore germination